MKLIAFRFFFFFIFVSFIKDTYQTNVTFRANEAKIRRLQTPTQYTSLENAFKMKPDSHGEFFHFQNQFVVSFPFIINAFISFHWNLN